MSTPPMITSAPWRRLAWWWNGSENPQTRRDVVLEHDRATGVFRVRWGLPQYDPDDRRFFQVPMVIELLKALLGETKSGWLEMVYLDDDGHLWDYEDPDDPWKAITNYLTPADD